jgi:hypothetical protein
VAQDLNDAGFASPRGIASLVVAVEAFAYAESLIRFLQNIPPLLAPDGAAVIAAPNVDALPARHTFLLDGKIRYAPRDSAHISAIPSDPFRHPFHPPAGLKSTESLLFPPKGYPLAGKPLARPLAWAVAAFSGDSVLADNRIFVFQAAR